MPFGSVSAFSEPSSFSMSLFVCICVSWSLREFLVSRNFLAFSPHGRDGKWKLTTEKAPHWHPAASTVIRRYPDVCLSLHGWVLRGKYGHTRRYSLPGKAWCTWRKMNGPRRRTFCLKSAEGKHYQPNVIKLQIIKLLNCFMGRNIVFMMLY